MEVSGPEPPRGPGPTRATGRPARSDPRARPAAEAADVPRLFSRVVDLGDRLDPLDLASEDGFVWRSPGGALVGTGQAARVAVGTGPGRIERAAEAVAALLDAVEVEDADGGPARPRSGPSRSTRRPRASWSFRPCCCAPTPTAGPGPSSPNRPRSTHPGRPTCSPELRAAASPGHPWPAAHRLDGPGADAHREGLWTAGSPDLPVR